MRELLILYFLLPLMAWAQSSLPPQPNPNTSIKCHPSDTEIGYHKDLKLTNCVGKIRYSNGTLYVDRLPIVTGKQIGTAHV